MSTTVQQSNKLLATVDGRLVRLEAVPRTERSGIRRALGMCTAISSMLESSLERLSDDQECSALSKREIVAQLNQRLERVEQLEGEFERALDVLDNPGAALVAAHQASVNASSAAAATSAGGECKAEGASSGGTLDRLDQQIARAKDVNLNDVHSLSRAIGLCAALAGMLDTILLRVENGSDRSCTVADIEERAALLEDLELQYTDRLEELESGHTSPLPAQLNAATQSKRSVAPLQVTSEEDLGSVLSSEEDTEPLSPVPARHPMLPSSVPPLGALERLAATSRDADCATRSPDSSARTPKGELSTPTSSFVAKIQQRFELVKSMDHSTKQGITRSMGVCVAIGGLLDGALSRVGTASDPGCSAEEIEALMDRADALEVELQQRLERLESSGGGSGGGGGAPTAPSLNELSSTSETRLASASAHGNAELRSTPRAGNVLLGALTTCVDAVTNAPVSTLQERTDALARCTALQELISHLLRRCETSDLSCVASAELNQLFAALTHLHARVLCTEVPNTPRARPATPVEAGAALAAFPLVLPAHAGEGAPLTVGTMRSYLSQQNSRSTHGDRQAATHTLALLRAAVSSLEVRDRKKGLKTHKRCFVAKELVDWLDAQLLGISNRSELVVLCQRWVNTRRIAPTSGDRKFQYDSGLFQFRYRATRTLEVDVDDIFSKAKQSLELKARKAHMRTYKHCFVGKEAVDWLVELLAPAFDREDAEEVFQTLVDWGRIESAVEPNRPFSDSPAFYRFVEYSQDRLMLGENAHLFPMRGCELALLRGQQQISCPRCKRDLAIDQLTPDLTLRGLPVPSFDLAAVLHRTPVGEGGYATVYRGQFKGETVACKLLHTKDAAEEHQAEANIAIATEFRREAWAMSKLSHPNIVPLLGVCQQPLAFLMELMPDGDLRSYLNDARSLSWPFRLQVAMGIAYALVHMHGGQPPICHLDLKSPNVLLRVQPPHEEDGRLRVVAKLADFGVSRSLGLTTRLARWDQRDNCIWQAPEMLRQDAFDASSDIYSLGIILWELLTAELPFAHCNWMSEIEERVLAGERPPVPERCEVPSFTVLMQRCWSSAPHKRPPASLCVRALERALKEFDALDPQPSPTLIVRKNLPMIQASPLTRPRKSSTTGASITVTSSASQKKSDSAANTVEQAHALLRPPPPALPPLPGLEDSVDAPPLPELPALLLGDNSVDSPPPTLPPSPFDSSADSDPPSQDC